MLFPIFTPTNQGLINGLSPNQAILGTFSTEMLHSDSTLEKKFRKLIPTNS